MARTSTSPTTTPSSTPSSTRDNGRPDQIPPATSPTTTDPRSTARILGDIVDDLRTLVRQELALAKIEITEALTARAQAAVAGLVGALFGVLVLVFGSTTLAVWLGDVFEDWIGWAIVTGGWLVLAMLALAFAAVRARAVPMKPQRTERSIEENVEWAKQQLSS